MERIQISLTGIESERLQLGFEGEQNHTRVVIYCSLIFEKYPDAVATMSIKPPTGDIYPKTLIRDGRKVIWEASAADCAIPGNGQYQLTFTDGDEIIKTYIGEYTVLPSLIGSGDPPDPVEDWLQEAQEALDAFEQDVSDAEAWAVGTREGDPVGSADPAYHNNSKYYAEQAGAIEQTIETTGAAQVSAIEAKGEEVLESIPSDYTELSEGVDELYAIKAPAITESASGSIASFTDGADDMPLKKLSVAIEPVQDLHGQDAPWPAGGGKNKLPFTEKTETINTAVFTINADGTVTTSGTPTSSAFFVYNRITLPAGAYKLYSNADTTKFRPYVAIPGGVSYDIGQEFSVSGSQEVIVYLHGITGQNLNGQTVTMMICLSTETDTSFAPYSNICPITGWDSVNVGVAEHYASIRSDAVTPYTDHGVTYNTDKYPFIKVNGTATGGTAYSGTIGSTNSSFRLPAGTHTLKIIGDIDNVETVIQFETGSGLSNVVLTKSNPSTTFTLSAECGIAWYLKTNSGQTTDSLFAIVYEEGQAYEYPFPQTAGTVYGGTLTIHQDGSGELVVDKGFYTITGNEEFVYSTGTKTFYTSDNCLVGIDAKNYASAFDGIASMLEAYPGTPTWSNITSGNYIGYNSEGFRFCMPMYGASDIETAVSKVVGCQICYKLATPVTYQITPQEIRTLLGQNNIWADTGDVALEYPADTKLYIDRKFAELQALILENISNS